MKRMVSLILAIIIALISTALCTLSVYAEDSSECNISLDDKFADNRVIVVMNNEASLKFKDYSVSDFKKYECKSVLDLSTAASYKVKEAIQSIADHVLYKGPLSEYNGIALGEYRQIICLELQEHGKENVISVIEELNKREDVYCAYPDYELTFASTTANDTHYDLQSYYDIIELEEAWDITTGSHSVIVGIIDSGIDSNHPEFNALDENTVNNLDSSLSFDFTTGNAVKCVPTDEFMHGTACAGVIGANGNDRRGISGICWDVSLASLKVFDNDGIILSSYVAAAINYSESINIPILNISLGWSEVDSTIDLYNHPLSTSISNYSGLVVCAAGNENKDNDITPTYPANYSLSNLITVGASTHNDERVSDSNFGVSTVDIFAPGNVLTTVDMTWALTHDSTNCANMHVENVYHYLSGTSFATSMVTGVAALMLSVNPNLSPEELKHIIMETSNPVSSLTNLCVSGGRLNAYEAVNHAQNHTLAVSVGQNMHTFYCNVCGYTKPENHDLYMNSEAQNAYHVKCATVGCSYEVICSHTPTYEYANTTEHTVSCAYGCFTEFCESHGVLTYAYTESNVTHNATCQDCGYTFSQPHDWIYKGSVYRCTLCGITSTQAPSIIQNLPPVNDEEDLTE